MSWFKVGQIVLSKAGHDKNRHHVVVTAGEDFVSVADGKHKKLASPKRKNCKHLQPTNEVVSMDSLTDKELRKIMAAYNLKRTDHLKKGENTLVKR